MGDWNAKVGSQETPRVTHKFGLGILNETGQRLIEFCQENALLIANTLFQQHKRRLYTWTSPDSQHQNRIDYILCSQRWRSSIHSSKTTRSWLWLRLWTPYCQNRLKLKKVGKTTRPISSLQFSSVSQSCLTLSTPWIPAHQVSLSIINSQS